jgi:uncharacterized membrane protein YhhN
MMPFPGGIDSLANGTLIISVGAACLYLVLRGTEPVWRRTLLKVASIALLALLAMVAGGPVLLVIALGLCAVGDGLLAQDGEQYFLGGLVAFLFGHLVYIWLFVAVGFGVGDGFGQILADPWRTGLIFVALVCAGAMAVRLLPVVGEEMRMPILAYMAAILAMLTAAATLPLPLVVAGAALFFVSDAILAAERYLLEEESLPQIIAGPAVWVLYYLGQMAIVLGFLL